MKLNVKPIYNQDYAPAFDIYTFNQKNIISEGIVWFESLDEVIEYANKLKIKGFSHVFSCVDEENGIEAAEHGVQWTKLKDYFDDPNQIVVCREPLGLTQEAINQKIDFLKSKIGSPYDYPGLVLGFSISFITRFQNIFPAFRKLPLPFHVPGSYVCSSLQSDSWIHTHLYSQIALFKEWNYTRIDVNKLFNHMYYKPLRFDKIRI